MFSGLRRLEGFQGGPLVPTTVTLALTEFYVNTYVASAKYLPASELVTEKTIRDISTTFRQVAQKAEFCRGATPPRLTGGDTDASVIALMNAATRTMISSIITAYSSIFDIWKNRGIALTKATTADPLGTALSSEILAARDAYIGSGGHWPTLLNAIQNIVKSSMIGNAKTGYLFRIGTPAGTGKLALAGKPIVQTLMNANATLVGSYVGATSVGFYWSTSSMGPGKEGATSVTATLTAGTSNFRAALPTTGTSALVVGTTYFYKAWAINSSGETLGVERSFVYAAAPSGISITSNTQSANTITFTCNLTNSGGLRILEKGIAFQQGSTLPDASVIPTLATRVINISGNEGTFTCIVRDLIPGTTYAFGAYARNELGTVVSGSTAVVFPRVPTVTTSAATGITTSGMTLNASITEGSNTGTISECGFYYSVGINAVSGINADIPFSGTAPANGTGALTTSLNVYKVIVDVSAGTPFAATLTGINYNTLVYYIAYAKSSHGDGYSTVGSSTTQNAVVPTVTTTIYSGAVTYPVILNGIVSNNGGATIITTGIAYKAGSSFSSITDVGVNTITSSTSTSVISVSIPGSNLQQSTTYYYASFATNLIGTSIGALNTFTTQSGPSANTNFVIISNNQTTLSLENSAGVGTPYTYNFIYSSMSLSDSSMILNADGSVPAGIVRVRDSASNLTSETLTSTLTKGQIYYYRAIIYNSFGWIGYGEIRKFKAHQNGADGGTVTTFTPTLSGKSCAGTRCNQEYTVHVFSPANTYSFNPFNSLNVEVLLVGGGGGGARDAGGGGGGGGFVTNINDDGTLSRTITITPTLTKPTFATIVGVGGEGAKTTNAIFMGVNGGNSSLEISSSTTITATGGGGGGNAENAGRNGGCGGGNTWWSIQSVGTAMSAIAGYVVKAFNGGDAVISGTGANTNIAGGGGGAGGRTTNGNGGPGAISFIRSNIGEGYAAGGGGGYQEIETTQTSGGSVTIGSTTIMLGGTGGSRGRLTCTNPSDSTAGGNAVANTGSGGGGSGTHPSECAKNGGDGSDGIIIIRYLTNP